MNQWLLKIGGRKFTLTVLVFVLTTALLTVKKLDESSYYTLVQMLLVAYPLANVGQAFLLKDAEAQNAFENDPLGGRKFQFAILSFLAFAGVLYFGYISDETYVKLTMWLVGVYVSGNVISKAADAGLTFTIGKKA